MSETLSRRIDDLEVTVFTKNRLRLAKVEYVYQLVVKTEDDLLRIKNFGHASLIEIKKALQEMGLSLGMEAEDATEVLARKRATLLEAEKDYAKAFFDVKVGQISESRMVDLDTTLEKVLEDFIKLPHK